MHPILSRLMVSNKEASAPYRLPAQPTKAISKVMAATIREHSSAPISPQRETRPSNLHRIAMCATQRGCSPSRFRSLLASRKELRGPSGTVTTRQSRLSRQHLCLALPHRRLSLGAYLAKVPPTIWPWNLLVMHLGSVDHRRRLLSEMTLEEVAVAAYVRFALTPMRLHRVSIWVSNHPTDLSPLLE